MTIEEMRLIKNIVWKSVDKDNMEFFSKISCYQLDALNKLLSMFTVAET